MLKKRPYQYNVNDSMDEQFDKYKQSNAMYPSHDVDLEKNENGELRVTLFRRLFDPLRS